VCVRQAVDWTRLLDHQVQACDVPAGVWHGPKPDFLVSAKSCTCTHMSCLAQCPLPTLFLISAIPWIRPI
jgi:hypothetical protein